MEPQICGDLEEMRPYGGKRKAPVPWEAGALVVGHAPQRGRGPDPGTCSRAGGTKVTDWRPTGDRFERSSWRHLQKFLKSTKKKAPGARGLVSRTISDAAMRPDPGNGPPGCGVAVTDWRMTGG